MLGSLPIISSLISALAWGIAPIFDKQALLKLDNNYLNIFFFKNLIGIFIGLLIFLIMKNKIQIKKLNIKIPLIYLFFSVLMGVLGGLFFFKALSKSKYTMLVILITYVLPILIVALLSRIILQEKLNTGMILGALLSIFGIMVFVYYSN